jgi:hypothetical protein
MAKDKIAYLYQRAEIDPIAIRKMKKSVILFSQRQIWYPSHHEPGKEPLELPKRTRVTKSLVVNSRRFLKQDSLLEIYISGHGRDENGGIQPVATIEFEDGESRLSWITEAGAYEEMTLPRDKDRTDAQGYH